MDIVALLFIGYFFVSLFRSRADYVLIAITWIILLGDSKEIDIATIFGGIVLSLLIYGCCKMLDDTKASIKN